MQSARLKNIIILILVLLNVCLLASLLGRQTSSHTARRQATEQIVALFAANSIRLDPEVIPDQTPPASLILERSETEERALVSFLLGDEVTSSDLGGGIYAYDGAPGAALFQDNGLFDIIPGDSAPSGSGEALCEAFCETFGYSAPVFSLKEGSGSATATQFCRDISVINCTVAFTLENGRLTAVTGTHLPTATTAAEQTAPVEPLSAISALSALLASLQETYAVVAAVTDMYPCYELQSTSTTPIALTPAWCIVTDTVDYYVNCYTGAVTHA